MRHGGCVMVKGLLSVAAAILILGGSFAWGQSETWQVMGPVPSNVADGGAVAAMDGTLHVITGGGSGVNRHFTRPMSGSQWAEGANLPLWNFGGGLMAPGNGSLYASGDD